MRTVGHATCVAFSKLGAFACPFMVISPASNVTVGIVLCVMNVVGAVASNFLPETTGTKISVLSVTCDSVFEPANMLLHTICLHLLYFLYNSFFQE
jgi:hypothetical protein